MIELDPTKDIGQQIRELNVKEAWSAYKHARDEADLEYDRYVQACIQANKLPDPR